MSIVAASGEGPPTWVWLVWLAAAAAMAVIFSRRRSHWPPSKDTPAPATTATPAQPSAGKLWREGLQPIPLLAMTGLASFCVWVAVQIGYVAARMPATRIDPATTLPAVLQLSEGEQAGLALLSHLAAYAVGVGLLIYGRGIPTLGYGLRRLPNGLLGGVIGVFIALPVVFFSIRLTEWLLAKFHISHGQKHELLRVMAEDPSRFVRTVAVAAAVIAAPLFEELLFRGCVQGGLRRATGSRTVGIVVASLLFASIHLAWTIPPIFVFSIFLGLVYERTRNLWAVTIMHALFNLFSVLTNGS